MAHEDQEKADKHDDPQSAGTSRREFIRSAAVKGAVAALFGAVTFDTVMARAMGRVSEVEAARRMGAAAADALGRSGLAGPDAPTNKTCIDKSCNPYSCVGGFTCTTWYSCTGGPTCSGGFLCEHGSASYTHVP